MRCRRAAAAGAAVLLVGAAATAARAQGDGDRARYRLATAVLGDVEQTLPLSGTIEHANRSEAGFGASGTVATVYVEPGDRVRTGQLLAELDASDLNAAVSEARATLAQARAQLETDQNAQEELVEEAAQPQVPSKEPQQQPQQPDPEPTRPSEPSGPDPALAAQQQAVRDAQTKATEAIAAAKVALATQQAACQVPEVESGEDPATTTADCTDALVAVQSAQDEVASAQDDLQAAIATLAETLTKALAQLSTTKPASTSGTESAMVAAIAMDTPRSEDSASSSAGSIASDQAAIDQAKVDLLSAQQQLAAAALRAPRSGTVAALDLAHGDRVSSGTTVLTVIGRGATTVAVGTTADQVTSLKVGQRATVTVPGRDRTFTGTVTSIGLLPTPGQESSTYPVTVTLEGGRTLPTGSTAGVAVVVDTALDVVTVPASAVTDASVRILEDGQAVTRKVTVGAVGATTVEVEGIEAGARVVLADRDAALPSQDTDQRTPGRFGDSPRMGLGGPGGGPVTFKAPG